MKKKISFFDSDLDGVNITSLKRAAIEEFTVSTLRCYDLPVKEVLTQPLHVKSIDLNTVSVYDCRKTYKPFNFEIGEEQFVMFTWRYSPQRSKSPVFLACSFDGWVAHEMSYQDHLWKIALTLFPGIYQYKFIVNAEWLIDKSEYFETDSFGIVNNTIVVEKRNSTLFNGFGAWFDVIFRGNDKHKQPLVLTTDPRTGYQTHWRQDVCLYRNNLKIPDNKKIAGVINIKPMNDYKRHFSITISPLERATIRGETCFPEQEWTF